MGAKATFLKVDIRLDTHASILFVEIKKAGANNFALDLSDFIACNTGALIGCKFWLCMMM